MAARKSKADETPAEDPKQEPSSDETETAPDEPSQLASDATPEDKPDQLADEPDDETETAPDVVEAPVAARSTWQPEQHVQENYEQLRAERDWSWAELADSLETTDPHLAAWMRGKGEAKSAPRGDARPEQQTR